MIKRKKRNSWWLKLLKKPLKSLLKKHRVPRQTIGIFMNPMTSGKERISIIRRFVINKEQKLD